MELAGAPLGEDLFGGMGEREHPSTNTYSAV
jgi:hypothetical protein